MRKEGIFIITVCLCLIMLGIIMVFWTKPWKSTEQPRDLVKQEISRVMCEDLSLAAEQENITSTKYYYDGEHCVFEVIGYSQEYLIFCEDEEYFVNIKLRVINVSDDFVQKRFSECQVTRNQ